MTLLTPSAAVQFPFFPLFTASLFHYLLTSKETILVYITSTSRGLHATPVRNPLPLSDGNEGFGGKCMFIHAMKFYII